MAKCAYCGTTIVFGGSRDGESRFCNDTCRHKGTVGKLAAQIPADVLERHVLEVHQGPCPRCNGAGPVDVHTSHRIWSLFFLSSWNSRPDVSCRSCGIKRKVGDAAFSLFLGWWSFPWGLIVTPIQIGRNVVGMFATPNPSMPSQLLRRMVSQNLAARFLQSEREVAQRS